MKKIKIIVLILSSFFIAHFSFANQKPHQPSSKELQKILDNANAEANRNSFDKALKLFIDYRKAAANAKNDPLVSFYVIESIGRIYLKVKQDPDAAIAFFTEALNDRNLADTNFDIIRSWLGRAKEWKNLSLLPKTIKDPKTLFDLGKKYYEHGIKLQKYTMDTIASADFSLASNYLVPFTIHFDKDPNIGDALYMMGEIRRRSWHDNNYWSENFYLMETIRRFPNTALAAKAYAALYEDVHFGYTGSSGDNTPETWIDLLKEFESLSKVKDTVIPVINKLN